MDQFYLIVIGIATVIFILCLTGVGLMMRKRDQKTVFPPTANSCPDGWIVDGSYCTIPENGSKNMGNPAMANANLKTAINKYSTVSIGKMSSDPKDWTKSGKNGVCAQSMWANQYGISWDGVSNYNSC
jgi:hypothetical protein